ncbi:MAG: hypothetical protein LBO69_08100 [Ignavibacteria bacterium]|jgi:hypothetical protein|nr:hypothetical protein [Ignavibacteria bacterium]
MGKGSQAKVYFVLYLAIVVELLIIIVERDEAEEHLNRQNNETMKIVESILSQLYSGSGSEGINTKPQDEITLPAESDMAAVKEIFGNELKTWRQYQIDVGVTDVTLAIKRKEGESSKEYDERVANMLSLANVEDLEYEIFFSPAQNIDSIPAFQPDDYIRSNNIDFMTFTAGQVFNGPNGEPWTFVGAYRLSFDKDASYSKIDNNSLSTTLDFAPVYKQLMRTGIGTAPRGMEDSVFFYSDQKTRESAQTSRNATKRSFVVNFEPPDRNKPGIYKLRFASRTNRILGVSVLSEGQRASSDENTKVNIGTVQLTVKDLKKVASELKRRHQELDKVPSLDELVNTRGPEFVNKMEQFNVAIADAKQKAETSNDAADLIGKIRLYEYVAKLVTPGQSVNFDQNRSNFDINVRVQTAKPSTAQPYVSVLTDNRCFTNAKHVFEIEAGPYKTGGGNRISGRIVNEGGATMANITFEPIDQGLTPNAKYRLIGTVDRELPEGKYKMRLEHQISSKTVDIEDSLQVYTAGLLDDKGATSYLGNALSYGRNIIRSFIPKSGNDIPASQFKTIVTFDGGSRKEINGYNITQGDGVTLNAEYNNCEINVVWIQQATNKSFTLFTSNNEIKLSKPGIYGDGLMGERYSGSANKFTVTASGIEIVPPKSGSKTPVALSKPQAGNAKTEIQGYTVSSQSIEEDGEPGSNKYRVTFELVKAPNSKADKTIQGSVEIPISVDARHPSNGKTSSVSETISVGISYTPSTGTKTTPTRSGTTAKPTTPKAPAKAPAKAPVKK